jgi:hypothetical protein
MARTLLFDAGSLARLGPLGNGLAEHGHERRILVSCEARPLAELVLGGELHRRLLGVVEDLFARASVSRESTGSCMPRASLTPM